MLLALAAVGSIAFLAHNAWYQHREIERAHARIQKLEDQKAAPAAK
jgi:hypothetical protein